MDNYKLEAPSESSSVNTRRFTFSAQRRYDNVRVRDSEISKRLCYDCGEIVCGGEREYQEHILVHEAVYLAYQLYHFENGLPQSQVNQTDNQQSQILEQTLRVMENVQDKLVKEKHNTQKSENVNENTQAAFGDEMVSQSIPIEAIETEQAVSSIEDWMK